jgi:hypothetical protein
MTKTNEQNLSFSLRQALKQAWTAETSADPKHWSPENPAWGQCAVTALIIQDLFGGALLRCKVNGISHYWNCLPSGEELDLTKDQFRELQEATPPEPRTREFVLSFPDTVRRYELLKSRLHPGYRQSCNPDSDH